MHILIQSMSIRLILLLRLIRVDNQFHHPHKLFNINLAAVVIVGIDNTAIAPTKAAAKARFFIMLLLLSVVDVYLLNVSHRLPKP